MTTARFTNKIVAGLVVALAAAYSMWLLPAVNRVETSVTSSTAGIIAISPVRVMETRPEKGIIGGHSGPFAAGEVYTLPILGQGGVPAFGVSAILANLTIVATTGGGYVTVWASGQPRPAASNINFSPNQVIANTFLVPVGADGAIQIYSYPAGINILIDIQAWVPATTLAAAGPAIPFTKLPLTSITGTKAGYVLNNAMKYAMNTWWNSTAQSLLALPLNPTNPQDAIRRLGMAALGISTSVATGSYSESYVGVSSSAALQRTILLIDRVASQHVTNTPGGWGDSWQSPMWAGVVGRAAWYIWNDLPSTTKTYVTRMIEHEANYGAGKKIKYMRNKIGTVLSPGDSGAEEVAWTMSAAQVAVVMLPNHPLRKMWMAFIAQSSLAAWARPQNVDSTTMVNGAPISTWINGSNAEADGTVINHNRVASDYSTTFYDNLNAAPLFALSNYSLPQASLFFIEPIYTAFTTVPFNGQFTYVPGTGDIYYPQGNDWGTGQRLPYALADALATTYNINLSVADQYLNLHLDAVLTQQGRFTDGHTYLDDTEYNYPGKEEHTMQLASQLYLTLYLRDNGLTALNDDGLWM